MSDDLDDEFAEDDHDGGEPLSPEARESLVAYLKSAVGKHQKPKPNAFFEASHIYVEYLQSAMRLLEYTRITVDALNDYKEAGIDRAAVPGGALAEAWVKALWSNSRRVDVELLRKEEHADAIAYGQ